jgi:citrate synthase
MLTGKKPSADATQLIDRDLILHAEHGSNASSFAARVVIGTEANLHAAITAAIAALSGPAHGGAAEDVMKMAEEIGDPSRAADYVKEKRRAGIAVTGFGHRVYRAEDPRARHMRAGVERLVRANGRAEMVRDPSGRGDGHGALCAAWGKCKRRFLLGRRVSPVGH